MKWLNKISKLFSLELVRVRLNNINNSSVSVRIIKKLVVLSRVRFKVTEKWFNDLLSLTYDDEIKIKYLPELHQSNDFERTHLRDILRFDEWKQIQSNQIRICQDYITEFNKSREDFYQVLNAESINITNPKSTFVEQIDLLHNDVERLQASLISLRTIFNSGGYQLLNEIDNLNCVKQKVSNPIQYNKSSWFDFLDKEPSEYYTVAVLFRRLNEVYYNLNDLNRMLANFHSNRNHKIIVGNAGSGKTHITAHLIESIKSNNDFVIFLKPKQFNGDNINFDERLLQLLRIPIGYTLPEILDRVNNFAKTNDRRCFIIIDALNETTKANIGFSNIWRTDLQLFINQIKLFSNLYFTCTLRTSYIDQIWSVRPSNVEELRGFTNETDVEEACKKYFNFYKIRPRNWDTADLSYFSVPLLLDLFCKLTNEKREDDIEIDLGIHTYVQVFQDYVAKLISEVQVKLNYLKDKLIKKGFIKVAAMFMDNNEAIISVDDFNDAFDKDDDVPVDKSIARLVLEGYLLFVKDFIKKNQEVVKHTQQEVGGYLLARKISDDFPIIADLVNLQFFKEKIIGDDTSKHHQLRLDILKFLIALRPELVKHLKDKDGLRLSWWYLYNGYSYNLDVSVEEYLLTGNKSTFIIEDILNVSSPYWFNTISRLNFNFIVPILDKLDIWKFETEWTFFIFKEVDFFYKLIDDNIEKIKERDESDANYYRLIAKFLAYVTSTNIRELRDFASIYLIEFGKKYPLALLELTTHSATLNDGYIYERLAACCYGVALNLQNNEQYINEHLPLIARRLYDLQFANNPKAAVYNYIVIDSIKHLLDLALIKKVSDFNKNEILRFSNYQYLPPYEWILPTEQQSKLINRSSGMSWPEPIGMDFGIYTIPRLMIENYVKDREAIANVYKRIFEIGYRKLQTSDFTDERFEDFYWGNSIPGYEGKVDRLGKKYSWKAFFDYAGFLLLNKQLNVVEKKSSEKQYYQRLADVDIDICLPNQNYKLDARLYHQNLLALKNVNIEWYKETKIDTISPLFKYEIGDNNYIMLYGKVDQRLNEGYDVRSFLLADTFFIKRNNQIKNLEISIVSKVFGWDLDVHFSADRLRHVYFGELYWADNIGENDEIENVLIPTGNSIVNKRKVTFQDTIHFDGYTNEDIGKEIEKTFPEKLLFDSESTLAEYLWESNSKILNGYSEYYPSIKMGKYLGLKADPSKGKILDANLDECFVCVEHKDENHFSNTFNYMRSDLVRRYMSDNDLVLVYQVKQHSYDESHMHNKQMKFFILE